MDLKKTKEKSDEYQKGMEKGKENENEKEKEKEKKTKSNENEKDKKKSNKNEKENENEKEKVQENQKEIEIEIEKEKENKEGTIQTINIFQDEESVKLQIASDMHLEMLRKEEELLEYSQNLIQAKGDILALLGDIGDPFQDGYANFLIHLSNSFKLILVIAGNHEYYHIHSQEKDDKRTMESTERKIQEICSQITKSKVIFLNTEAIFVKLQNRTLRILGTTLWSHIPSNAKLKVGSCLNDYRMIYLTKNKQITVEDTMELFNKNKTWIQKHQYESALVKNEELIVLTHHSPSLKNTSDPKYEKQITNHAFSSNLEEMYKIGFFGFFKKKKRIPKIWASGHTHYNFHIDKNATQLIANQRGYPWEKVKNWNPEFSIEI
ncbi:ser/thr protein phosphatase superfamily [Anaeramoeba flamelloides]|uniref:Ser/thr protein phosphatase superfamily n=1 Tax=Anaeramoeba flamelloides TaxID=1746091 RepID=A0ABQ8YVG6_9EUKA|nr:ser/thr protein phosphatase superfamily [Anaeramoeba flamelloides]